MTSPTHDVLDPGTEIVSADDPRVGVVIPKQSIALPSLDEWRMLESFARTAANSGLVKARELRGNPEACLIVILKGRELRLSPAESLHSVFIIEGVPTLRASSMQGIVLRDGHQLWPGPCDDKRATVHAKRRLPDSTWSELVTVEWTIEEAQRAKLLSKDNWRNYPGDMLYARAVSRCSRRMFADVLMGCVYVPEEMGAIEVNGTFVVPEARRGGQVGYEQPRPALAPGDEEPEPEPMPPYDDLMREFHGIARTLGKKPAQLAARWIAAHKKNVEDASPQELYDLVKSLRTLVADRPTPPAEETPATAGEPGAAEEAPAGEPAADAAEPAAAETAPQPTPETAPDPHRFEYNDDGDNDFCIRAGCGQPVDADVHAARPGDGQEPLIP